MTAHLNIHNGEQFINICDCVVGLRNSENSWVEVDAMDEGKIIKVYDGSIWHDITCPDAPSEDPEAIMFAGSEIDLCLTAPRKLNVKTRIAFTGSPMNVKGTISSTLYIEDSDTPYTLNTYTPLKGPFTGDWFINLTAEQYAVLQTNPGSAIRTLTLTVKVTTPSSFILFDFTVPITKFTFILPEVIDCHNSLEPTVIETPL